MADDRVLAVSVDVGRDHTLRELAGCVDLERLKASLEVLIGADFRLMDGDGTAVVASGITPAAWPSVPLGSELEPLGYLQADPARHTVKAAVQMLDLLFHAARRYAMAAELHYATVQADYEALQAEHLALQASEARYRALAGDLERRVAEQVATIEKRQRQLYQSERLASVGRLAAGVAHEINNPMAFVLSNLSTATRYVDELRDMLAAADADGGESAPSGQDWRMLLTDFGDLLEESRGGVQRVSRIVGDLRDFSRVDRADEDVADVNELVAGVCHVIGPQLRAGTELTHEAGTVPPLRCRPGHLSQAIYNVVLNAQQAVGDRGHIRVRTGADDAEVWIAVDDDGCGIAPDVMPHIFEPFFTSREVGQGAGLGLTVCDDVVRALGGHVEARSDPGKGSTFTLHLPRGGRD